MTADPVAAVTEALRAAIADVDNPVAAARALGRLAARYPVQYEGQREAIREQGRRALEPFHGQAAKAVAWAVLDGVWDAQAGPGPGEATPSDVGAPLPHAIPASEAGMVEPPSYLVDEYLPREELVVPFGDGGAWKTATALATSAAVAAGEALFDRFQAEQGPVLYVSEEDGIGVLANRLEAIARGHGWPLATVMENVHFLAREGASLDDEAWRGHLLAEAVTLGAVLAFFDPYAELTLARENLPDEAKPNIKFFRRLNAAGLTVGVNHHAGKKHEGKRKVDRVRGASSLYAAARAVFLLEPVELGFSVECLKMSRAAPPERFVVSPTIEADPAAPAVWQSARLAYLAQEKAASEEADAFLVDMLRRYPGTNSTGLKDLAKGRINAVEVSAAIRRLETVGRIRYEDGPRGAKEWHLTDSGDPAQKSRAGSATFPADPAQRLLSRVGEDASTLPLSLEGAGSAGVQGGTEQPGGWQPEPCPECGEDLPPDEALCERCEERAAMEAEAPA